MTGAWAVSRMSPGSIPRQSATTAASGAYSRSSGRVVTKRAAPAPAVQAIGPTPSSSTISAGPPSSFSATAAPMVGWPAKGTSCVGVKMRSRAVWAGSFGGRTKTVSEKLNSRAIFWKAPRPAPRRRE
jgi:hypothetical protein